MYQPCLIHHEDDLFLKMSTIDGAREISTAANKDGSSLGKRSIDDSRLSPITSLDPKARRIEGDDDDDDDEKAKIPLQIKVDLAGSQTNMIGIQKPVQITSFSYDENRKLYQDDRSRKYYHPPPQNANLNRGYETRIERDENGNEHLDSLLEALIQNAEVEGQLKQSDLITWRGMMTKLCTILYEDQQGFEMNVMLLDGILYIEEHIGEAKLADRKRSKEGSERSKRNTYYGYSFESWTCHSCRESGTNGWDGDVNTNVQWCSVVKTKLGSTRMILGGEVDAVDPILKLPIEVKTSRDIRSAKDEEFFEKKMLRFYMQSYLLGIQKVIVGFRDNRGYLVTTQEMDTLAMPRAVRGKPHAWDPMACLKAASDILETVKTHLCTNTQQNSWPDIKEAESSGTFPVFRMTYVPSRSSENGKLLTLTQLTKDQILHEVKGGKEEGYVGFLTSKYYQHIRKGHVE